VDYTKTLNEPEVAAKCPGHCIKKA